LSCRETYRETHAAAVQNPMVTEVCAIMRDPLIAWLGSRQMSQQYQFTTENSSPQEQKPSASSLQLVSPKISDLCRRTFRSHSTTTMKLPLLVSLLVSPAIAFVVSPSRSSKLKLGEGRFGDNVNGLSSTSKTATATTSSSAVDFLQTLLDDLVNDADATRLIKNSSQSWKTAIYEAIGAPDSTDVSQVSKTLTAAMSKPNNQFAILLGKAQEFTANFPSDPVDYQEGEAFVEVQLREKQSDDLLVTMGLQLEQRDTDGQWLVAKLDWQDFRDQFYPGLSGREWLRAF
jgi:hypothetical protein